MNRGNILSRLMIIVFGVAVLTLAACATATPSPASDIPGGAGTGIQVGTPAATPTDSSAVGQNPSISPSPLLADQDLTANSIDVVYSIVASMIGGEPLSPLFADWPEDRPAIDRLASALGSAMPITPTEHLTANDRGRYLTIRYRNGAELMVRQVSWCEDWGGRRDFIGGACRGEHKPLTDTWWVEGTGMVKSSDLGSWWEDMTSFMVPIGGIIAPESINGPVIRRRCHPGPQLSGDDHAGLHRRRASPWTRACGTEPRLGVRGTQGIHSPSRGTAGQIKLKRPRWS